MPRRKKQDKKIKVVTASAKPKVEDFKEVRPVYAIGNWKMNPGTINEAKQLYRDLIKQLPPRVTAKVVVCPPMLFAGLVKEVSRSKRIRLGVQSVHHERSGSHTGESAADQAVSVGATYAIIGHSERRAAGETDAVVAAQVAAAGRANLIPVLCIGEQTRDDKGTHLETLRLQIQNSLKEVSNSTIEKMLIAYEPIWAIGATEAMDASDIHESVLWVRKVLAETFSRRVSDQTPILYGGSVTDDNIISIMEKGRADGVLVGRASLSVESFIKIIKATRPVK